MSNRGTNNGGGPRWATMPRGTCPRCGLNKPIGVLQEENGLQCHNREKCEKRRIAQSRNLSLKDRQQPTQQ